MSRPNLSTAKRVELIPTIAQTFARLGFRRATTSELARRCGVQENILYRLWPDKKAMFIAAIDHVYEVAAVAWERVSQASGEGSTAERLLDYESKHLGEYGYIRIVFAGLMEADDPDIRRALANLYRRYQAFVAHQVRTHRNERSMLGDPHAASLADLAKGSSSKPDAIKVAHGADDADLSSWALVGLGIIGSIARELNLLDERERQRLVTEAGRRLLD